MKTLSIVKIVSLLNILFTPITSATYYHDTSDIQQQVIAEAKRQNIPPSLALAIAKVESNFNPKALSHAGAKGVMQIMPRTAEQVFGVSRNRLYESNVNIKLGVKFIKRLIKRYDGRLDIALSHYNGGSAVKNRQGELNVIPGTRHYVDKVLANQQDFLQHDNPLLITANYNQTANQNVLKNMGKNPRYAQESDSSSQAPKIETLRALRLHNITRNYKGKSAPAVNDKATSLKGSPTVLASRNTKMAKVRQWESIYDY